jgi:hypothetical protein
MPDSSWASWSWPCARSAATACALVMPAGSDLPTRPLKMTLVALPMIFGPTTANATLA